VNTGKVRVAAPSTVRSGERPDLGPGRCHGQACTAGGHVRESVAEQSLRRAQAEKAWGRGGPGNLDSS
jgi:hypothetical protein